MAMIKYKYIAALRIPVDDSLSEERPEEQSEAINEHFSLNKSHVVIFSVQKTIALNALMAHIFHCYVAT